MATLLLNEEITDRDRMKIRNNEYPILTESQREEREKGDAEFIWAQEIGADGVDYRPQTRDTKRKNALRNEGQSPRQGRPRTQQGTPKEVPRIYGGAARHNVLSAD